jgi:hypothetical protein
LIVLLASSHEIHATTISGDTTSNDLTVNGADIFFGPTSMADQFRMLWRPVASPNITQGVLYFDAERQQAQFEWRDDLGAAAKRKMTLDYANALRLFKADGTTVGVELIPDTNRLDLRGGGIYSNGTALLTVGSGTVPSFTSLLTSGDATINNVKVGTGGGNIASNTVVGTTTLVANTVGSFNSAFGDTSLEVNTSGSNNSAFGAAALADNTTGSYNVGVGVLALSSNTSGGSNTGIGHQSGVFLANGTTPMTAPSSCVFIGASTKGKLIDDSNAIVIGANAVSEGSNTTVIGTPNTVETHLAGKTITSGLDVAGDTVLTGSTTLNGQVTLSEPQGDISMGIYGN